MKAFQSVSALAEALREDLKDYGCVIGLDGFMLSGKTTLAFELANLLSGIRMGLDSYVDPNFAATNYAEKLKIDYLAQDIKKLTKVFPFVVVDGICLLDVFERISQPINATVYIKRMSQNGVWHDGYHLEDFEAGGNLQETNWLAKCEMAYHSIRLPHEHAQYLFQRVAA